MSKKSKPLGFFTTPRIIGILLVIIAVLSYQTESGGVSLGIAGLILLLAPKRYAQSQWDMFVETFSDWKLIITTALYDALFWLTVLGAGYFYLWRLKLRADVIQQTATFTKEAMLQPDLAIQNTEIVKQLVFFLLGGLTALLVISFIAYVIFRALSWSTVAKQKFDKKFLLAFTRLNAVWWLIWLVPVILTAMSASQTPDAKLLLGFIFIVAGYFTPIVDALFMKKRKVSFALGHGIAFGISKVHRFIVPYTFAIVLYAILYQLFRIAQQYSSQIVQAASMLFVVLFLAWLRTYLYQVVIDLPEE